MMNILLSSLFQHREILVNIVALCLGEKLFTNINLIQLSFRHNNFVIGLPQFLRLYIARLLLRKMYGLYEGTIEKYHVAK